MGKDVWFYSFTLEPDRDSPEVLAEYAKRFDVGPGWLFLTGNPEDLETLRENLGFAWSDPVLDADLTNHIGTVKMGNVPRGWWAASPSLTDPRSQDGRRSRLQAPLARDRGAAAMEGGRAHLRRRVSQQGDREDRPVPGAWWVRGGPVRRGRVRGGLHHPRVLLPPGSGRRRLPRRRSGILLGHAGGSDSGEIPPRRGAEASALRAGVHEVAAPTGVRIQHTQGSPAGRGRARR